MECLRIGRAEMKGDRCHRDGAESESGTDYARLGKGRRPPLPARKPRSIPDPDGTQNRPLFEVSIHRALVSN